MRLSRAITFLIIPLFWIKKNKSRKLEKIYTAWYIIYRLQELFKTNCLINTFLNKMKTPLLEQTIEQKSSFMIKEKKIVNVKNECTVKISSNICKWSLYDSMVVTIFRTLKCFIIYHDIYHKQGVFCWLDTFFKV